ncbi:hypothetical protein BsIDN1_65730 [Bacillus safensis]|uniref:peptidoglycan glycosyltransferase n=1 Tax=Bacillus safensis TaxID=561879 RepID=A0A5S9MJK2_BACIA|nr:hypothetical protein BsIDN1_65730 [Bacillus safensis]
MLFEEKQKREQILDEKAAFVTTDMMSGMFNDQLNGYTSVTGRTIIKDLTRTYGGKSGTTGADSWMIGFSPQLVTGVWTGYDKGRTIDSVEETAYAKKKYGLPLWNQLSQSSPPPPSCRLTVSKGYISIQKPATSQVQDVNQRYSPIL